MTPEVADYAGSRTMVPAGVHTVCHSVATGPLSGSESTLAALASSSPCCKPMIRHVTDSDLERVRAFLESHVDTSLFLLSTLAALGPRLGHHLNSGNFRKIEENGEIVAVFCLTRRGNLLVQAGGRIDLAEQIFEACESEPIEVRGVVGEWPMAEALWKLLRADPRFETSHNLKDVLYRLMLKDMVGPMPASPNVRLLDAADFAQWERLNTAYFAELSLPLQATLEQRRNDFIMRVRSGLWWGAFDDNYELVSIAALNATYGPSGRWVACIRARPIDARACRTRSCRC